MYFGMRVQFSCKSHLKGPTSVEIEHIKQVWNVKCWNVLYKNVALHVFEVAANQFLVFVLLQGNENGITLISDNPFIKKKELAPFEKGIRIDYILFKVGGRAFRSPHPLHFNPVIFNPLGISKPSFGFPNSD